ncbi:MAG: aldose 1-epimerase family protein [Clostridia bacterium]|nr:aldose 1-epimerase family protein [Clostridia bacterium]
MDGRISNLRQVASLRRYEMKEGREKGLEIIDCDNGKLRFLLNVSKGLDIMQLYHEGQNVSFLSKNAFTAREIPFLNRFEGGMLYTCGLDNAGGREGYTQHGTYHETTAEIICARCDENGIYVEAEIRASALFGKNLLLRRKIWSAIGEETLHLEDTLTNEAFVDDEYVLLYHVNVGYPMLDEGAKIELDPLSVQAVTPYAEQTMASRYEMSAPKPAEEEVCYYHTLKTPRVAFINEKIGKKFTLGYSGDTLPVFLEWKSMASGDYAVGLEPCTSKIGDSTVMQPLKAGASVKFSLDLSVNKL